MEESRCGVAKYCPTSKSIGGHLAAKVDKEEILWYEHFQTNKFGFQGEGEEMLVVATWSQKSQKEVCLLLGLF